MLSKSLTYETPKNKLYRSSINVEVHVSQEASFNHRLKQHVRHKHRPGLEHGRRVLSVPSTPFLSGLLLRPCFALGRELSAQTKGPETRQVLLPQTILRPVLDRYRCPNDRALHGRVSRNGRSTMKTIFDVLRPGARIAQGGSPCSAFNDERNSPTSQLRFQKSHRPRTHDYMHPSNYWKRYRCQLPRPLQRLVAEPRQPVGLAPPAEQVLESRGWSRKTLCSKGGRTMSSKISQQHCF